jgi:hypothetical protein
MTHLLATGASLAPRVTHTAHSGGNIGGNITHLNAFWRHGIPINEERKWGGN